MAAKSDIAGFGGAGGARTLYLFNAIEALSQLSYSPSDGRDTWAGTQYSTAMDTAASVMVGG